MAKKITKRAMALIMSAVMLITATPVFAASTGSVASDPNIGEDTVQNAKTEYDEVGEGNTSTNVYLTVDNSDVLVGVPTSIILSGTPDNEGNYTGEYSVKASGDISGDQSVMVEPKEETVSLVQKGKDNTSATITQEKTIFTSAELSEGATTTGKVTANGLTAGSWNGQTVFEIGIISNYSLYSSLELAATDANKLTTENADVMRDDIDNAVCGLYISDDTAYIRMFKDESDLSNIVLNNNTEINLDNHTVYFSNGAYLETNADLSVFNGSLQGNNANYVINEASSTASLALSNVDVNLTSTNNANTFALYTMAVKNNLNNVDVSVSNNTSYTVGGLIISGDVNFNNQINDCYFSIVNTGGSVRAIQSKGTTVINGGEFIGEADSGQTMFIYDMGNCTIANGTVVNCVGKSGYVYTLASNSTENNLLNIEDVEINSEIETGSVAGLILGNTEANIYDVNVNVVTHGNSASSTAGIASTVNKSAHINLYKGNIVCNSDYDGVGTGINCGSGSYLNVLAEESNDVYVYGRTWGISSNGTTNINGGTYESVAHPLYLSGGSNATIENAKIYSVSSESNPDNVNGPVYLGGTYMSSDAVITFKNCVFGNPDIHSPVHKFCMVSTTLSGYQDPAEVNIYDCDFYQGYYSVFSYNGSGTNQTKFNIYGDTHFYKSYNADSNQWIEYNNDEVSNLLSNWKTTLYANRSVGNHFVMSYGNGTVEDGIVISIPIKNDANIYDYR